MVNYLFVASPFSTVILTVNNNVVVPLRLFVSSYALDATPAIFYTQMDSAQVPAVGWGDQVGSFRLMPNEAQEHGGAMPVEGLGCITLVPMEINSMKLNQLLDHLGAISYQLFRRGKQRSLLFSTNAHIMPVFLPRFNVRVTQVSTMPADAVLQATFCQRLGIEPYMADLANEEVSRFLQGFQFSSVLEVKLPHHLYKHGHMIPKTINVGGISYKAQKRDIKDFFSNFGPVTSVSFNTRAKGSRIVFIKFGDEGIAKEVINQSHEDQGIVFRSVRLDIRPAYRTEIWCTATGRVPKKGKTLLGPSKMLN